MASQRKIEMHWVCSSCGTRNLGRHKKCQHCGDPKDASEPWLMPEDPGRAPSVTDPALLAQAGAGADWQCGFCGSHQKRLDGRCAHCGAAQSDGARVPEGGARREHAAAAPVFGAPAGAPAFASARSAVRRWRAVPALVALAVGLPLAGAAVCCVAALVVPPPPPRLEKPAVLAATLGDQRWQHLVHVERYQIVREDGFAEVRPADAMDVRSLGQRHHHDEQVLDHMRTETYEEQVPYQDTETYTDQEQCGEDCTTTPEHCSESCSPDDNGFATCTTTCSGGGQSCSPRYCSVTRTRSVTRYRAETRTRQVPVYRAEPRYQEFFEWNAWRWRPARVIEASGAASDAPRWPSDEELAPPAPLGEGERERTRREARYSIDLVTAGGVQRYVARDLSDYQRVRAHGRWYVSTERGLSLVKPVPAVSEPRGGARASR